jgi:phosphate transport system permease protein
VSTVDITVTPSAEAPVSFVAQRTWRSTKSSIMTVLMAASFVVVLIPLGLVLFTVIQKGLGVFGWSFITKDIPIRAREVGPGMGPAVVGTLLITLAATVLAVPLGILGAIYLNEYGGNGRLTRLVRFLSTVMTGVPSVVMGLFVYVTFTLRFGLKGIGGALALAALMLPVVIRTSEEMLRLVPNNLREASLALGTSKSRTILTVVLPAAMPGVVSGSLLAVARAAGETAPLIFTIGATKELNSNLFSGVNTSLSAEIFRNATEPFAGANERAWGAALTLILITFILTVFARIISSRFALQR